MGDCSMISKFQAIQSLRPNSSFEMDGDVVRFLDGVTTVPTSEEIEFEIARLQAEEDANAYKYKRVVEYPSIQEQLDMQYWDKINGTNTWEQAIQAVKQKYPKPE